MKGYYVCIVDAGFEAFLDPDCNGRTHYKTGGIFDNWCPLSQHPHYIDMKIALTTFTGGT